VNPPTAADGTSIDDWIAVQADGRIAVRTGKVELGTGLTTALAQIAAEELDVSITSIDMVGGRTDVTPDEGYTAGSRSIEAGGSSLRRAAAEARAVLLELAVEWLGLPDGTPVEVVDGVVHAGAPDGDGGGGARRSVTYGELLGGRRFDRVISGKATLKNPNEYQLVGSAAQRLDIPAKVRGLPSFVSDVRVPGMMHARIVRPAWFGCPLLSVDDSELPDGATLVRKGDFLAVVAKVESIAVHGAELLRASWGPGDAAPEQPDLWQWMSDQSAVEEELRAWGSPAAGLTEHEYRWPFQAHGSIGPATAVADVRGSHATVYAAAQGVYQLRAGLATLLDLPPESIEIIHREGPGCYGHNGADDAAADAAVVSQLIGQPVRVQWSRRDEFVWARKGPATVAKLSGAVDADGAVTHWQSSFCTSTHGGRARTPDRFVAGQFLAGITTPDDEVFMGGDRNGPIDYEVPNQQVTMRWLRRAAIPGSSLRALGAAANTFANESFMDELAQSADVDPVEFRLRHLQDPRGRAVLIAAAEHAGWGTPLPEGRGRGVAYARYENHAAYLAAVVEVTVDLERRTFTVDRFVIAHDCGLVINPDGLRNQIEGNVVQSLSRSLIEEVDWEPGKLLSVDWDTYPILRFPQVPPIEIVLIDRPDEPAVGAGEPATILTAPAIANAIFDACSVRLRQVPLTNSRLRAALSTTVGAL
jgi:nicotinate dehydrogenase subunit B